MSTVTEILRLVEYERLFTPLSFAVASDEARQKICNGAGVKGFDVPDSFLGLSITPSADRHDWMYSEAKDKAHKELADLVFLFNMLVQVVEADQGETHFVARRKFWLRLKFALVYFVAVWRFGIWPKLPKLPMWARVVDYFRRIF